MSDVKRYIVVLHVPNDSPFRQTGDSCLRSKNAEVVLASDYDALAAERQRLRGALVEVMRVMPCLPPAAKQIAGMPDRYETAVKAASAALAGSKEGE